MVHKKARKRQTIKNNLLLFLTLLGILIVTLVVCLCLLIFGNNYSDEALEISNETTSEMNTELETDKEPLTLEEAIPDKIDFQPMINEWVTSAGGSKSVIIYDLEREEIVGEYNSERNYNTASLYKLFVVYEGYRRIESGEWDAEAKASRTRYTISECLDLAIRESNSVCTETIWKMIGHDELEKIVEEDFEIKNTSVEDLVSNAKDIMNMMKIFYEHKDIKDDKLLARMKDSFLNQPTTEYNWRQGLPSGFINANVYNKVGWDYDDEEKQWSLYHDAAIVEFPSKNRHFIVVAMTRNMKYQQNRRLGSMIESTFYNN